MRPNFKVALVSLAAIALAFVATVARAQERACKVTRLNPANE